MVDASLEAPEYTAYRLRTLDFHTDMSRYLRPPEFTVIRCMVPDDDGGGENLVLHVDDVFHELRRRNRQDIIDVMVAMRPLSIHLESVEVVDN